MSEGRYELKYALPREQRGELLDAAEGSIEVDMHGADLTPYIGHLVEPGHPTPRGYRVHSLYLDSPLLEGYSRRLARARIRNRIRIRTYGDPGDDGPIFLEAKRKLGRQVIKHRVRAGGARAWATYDAEHPWRDAVAHLVGEKRREGDRWLAVPDNANMVPVTLVHYVREVYVAGSARFTIDHKVRASSRIDPRFLQADGDIELIPDDWMVLELKFNHDEPAWMRRVVQKMKLLAEPVSKFALGVGYTLRADRLEEIQKITPPSIVRHERLVGFAPPPALAVAR